MRIKDRVKNFIIIAEILSIIILLYFTFGVFLRADNYHESVFAAVAEFFLTMKGERDAEAPSASINNLTYPLRAAARHNGAVYASYGDISETKRIYESAGTALAGVLGSMGELAEMPEERLRGALAADIICFYFDGTIPLFLIADAGGGINSDMPMEKVSFIAMSAEGNGITFLCRTQDGSMKFAETVADSGDIASVLSEFPKNNAAFACELGQDFERILPETAVPKDNPYCTGLTVQTPDLDSGSEVVATLLDAFGYNKYTVKRYSENNGTQGYVQDSLTLKVRNDGFASFAVSGRQRAADANNFEKIGGEIYGISDFAADVRQKICGVYGSFGMSGIYVKDFSYDEQTDSGSIVFGCEVGGIPVCMADGSGVARVDFEKNNVVSAYMHLKKYSEDSSRINALLPFKQAAALINGDDKYSESGIKMFAGYFDSGDKELSAEWCITENKDRIAVESKR